MRVDHIPGVTYLKNEAHVDHRGAFVELCGSVKEYDRFAIARNERRHTLRGLHFSEPAEAKFVTCVRGAIFDVVVDMREGPTKLCWYGVVLGYGHGDGLCVPAGVAHGYMTLCDNSDVAYLITGESMSRSRGLMWSDPALGIEWPAAPVAMSDADKAWSLL